MNCGPSGPWGRTVRLLLKILGQKHCGFCVCSLFELRTVRPWGADSPPVTSRFSQRRLQIGWFEVLNGGQSAKTQFSRDLSVTASLGPHSINRGCGRPFEMAEHLGDLVSMCESA